MGFLCTQKRTNEWMLFRNIKTFPNTFSHTNAGKKEIRLTPTHACVCLYMYIRICRQTYSRATDQPTNIRTNDTTPPLKTFSVARSLGRSFTCMTSRIECSAWLVGWIASWMDEWFWYGSVSVCCCGLTGCFQPTTTIACCRPLRRMEWIVGIWGFFDRR